MHGKYILFVTLVLLAEFVGAQTLRRSGGEAGGGGSRLRSAFKLRAARYIAMVENIPAANALCPASAMDRALRNVDIRSVRALPGGLEAQYRPGAIDLVQDVWEEYLYRDTVRDENVFSLTIHEIYRHTPGCDDDKNDLSTAVTRAVFGHTTQATGVSDYDRLFTLKYPVAAPTFGNGGLYISIAACEAPVDLQRPSTPGIRCLLVGRDSRVTISMLHLVQTTTDAARPLALLGTFQSNSLSSFTALDNITRFATPAQPLYVIMHLQSGHMSYGVNLARMTFVF